MNDKKPMYSDGIIINPTWGIVSHASLKQILLFQWGIRIGKEDIPLNTFESLIIKDGCLVLQHKKRELRFAVRARHGSGKIDKQATVWLKDLITSLREGNVEMGANILDKLRQKKRNDSLFIATIVLLAPYSRNVRLNDSNNLTFNFC